MNSGKNKFDVLLIDSQTKKALPFLQSKEKQFYVCTEANQPFIIRLKAKLREKVFGAKLFIDGKEAIKDKTFKDVGHFFGFKQGFGNYKEFIFDTPEIKPVVTEKENSDSCSIYIEFYETYSVKEENLSYEIKKEKEYPQFEQLGGNENKKFYLRSLSVRQGNKFKIDSLKPNFLGKYKTSNYIDFEKKIDSIKIFYADFVALQIMGLLSLRNLDHLLLIPESKWDLQTAVHALQSILGNNKYKEGMKISDVEGIFEAYTKKSLKNFIKGDLYNFFQTKSSIFRVNDTGVVKLTDREGFRKKFCEIPPFIDKNKYLFSKNKIAKEEADFEALKNKRNRVESEIIKLDD
jgi:hypothetical protein